MTVFLDEARAIGDRLAREAVHHQDRCNWLTRAVPYRRDDGGGDMHPEVAPLNPTVYSGTAGMALFFGRLWRLTGDPAHRRTATAALNHALRHAWWRQAGNEVGEVGGRWRFGFYMGTAGIAWTAWEVGHLLDAPQYARDAARLVRDLAATVDQSMEWDVMFGAAGGVAALCSMNGNVPDAVGLAVRLGDLLLQAARREDTGWSWPLGQAAGDKPFLTGLSHGTAGVGAALATLAAASGESRFRDAAEMAFRYEQHHYDADARNWPNFQLAAGPDGRYPCSTSWCHGAPGIGLARTVALRVLDDPSLVEDARVAVETSTVAAREALEFPGRDYMLCHGTAGTLECVWVVAEALGDHGVRDRMRAVGSYAIEQYGEPARRRWNAPVEWPTGVTSGVYPPLVTGVAGVAHWLLRLHDPDAVPTVLLPGVPSPR